MYPFSITNVVSDRVAMVRILNLILNTSLNVSRKDNVTYPVSFRLAIARTGTSTLAMLSLLVVSLSGWKLKEGTNGR